MVIRWKYRGLLDGSIDNGWLFGWLVVILLIYLLDLVRFALVCFQKKIGIKSDAILSLGLLYIVIISYRVKTRSNEGRTDSL